MKNKIKRIILPILTCMLVCVGIFAMLMMGNVSVAGAVDFGHFSKNKISQSNFLTVDSAVSGSSYSKEYKLYFDSNSNKKIDEYFTHNLDSEKIGDGEGSSTYEVFVHSANNSSSVVKHNGEAFSQLNFSPNMVLALNAGYLSFEGQAFLTSKSKDGGFLQNDGAETIHMKLFVYNTDNSDGFESETLTVSKRDAFVSDADRVSLSVSKNTVNCNAIIIQFKSKYNNVSSWDENYMAIKRPEVIVSTSDHSAPSIELDYSEEYALSRDVKVNVSDFESGIQKIRYRLGGGEWTSVAEDSFKAYTNLHNFSVNMTKNETLEIETTDNVGNVSTKQYTETKIDNCTPSLNIEFDPSREDTDMHTFFTATLLSNTANGSAESAENFYYTYTVNGEPAGTRVAVNNGKMEFIAEDVGVYCFTFVAEDEVTKSEQTISLTFKKLLMVEDVVSSYTYSLSGNDFKFGKLSYSGGELSDAELSAIALGFSLTCGEQGAERLTDVGEYNYQFTCSEYYIVSNSSGSVQVLPYELQITFNGLSKEYSAEGIDVDFTLNEEGARDGVEVSYTCGGLPLDSAPVEVGEYQVTVSYTKNSNFTLNEQRTFTVTKRSIRVIAKDKTITYGDPIGELEFEVENGIASNNLESLFTLCCEESGILNVKEGGYSLYFKQQNSTTEEEDAILKNYVIEYISARLYVEKQRVLVYVDALSKEYGDSDPSFTFTIKNLAEKDIEIETIGTLSRALGEDVGNYQMELGTLSSANYELTLVPSVFQINKRMAAINIASATKVYGDADPEFTFTEFDSGFSKILEADMQYFKQALCRTAGEDVGKYIISINTNMQGVSNYIIISADGTLEITKKSIVVNAKDETVEYGLEPKLEYEVLDEFGSSVQATLDGSLIREEGEALGTYTILQGTLGSNNYNIEFHSATLTIVPRSVVVKVLESSKTYGEQDRVNLQISSAGKTDTVVVTDKPASLESIGIFCNITLHREAGEDVRRGGYLYTSCTASNGNYTLVFEAGSLIIEKRSIDVNISSCNKNYGEADPEFGYSVSGTVFDGELNLKLQREPGEDVGTYAISLAENDLTNYTVASSNSAELTINKANLNLRLQNKTVAYSGAEQSLDLLDTDLEFTYTYKYNNLMVVDSCVDAGEYSVTAHFNGNNNYFEYETSAVLTITAKLIPVVLKTYEFNYSGKVCSPVYELNINESVSTSIKFYDSLGQEVLNPVEVGVYTFEIVSNDPNYVCDYQGQMIIYEIFFSETVDGDASAVSSGVGTSSLDIHLYENKNEGLGSIFTASKNNRKTMGVYSFTNPNTNTNGEIFTVRIAANAGKDVEIYTIDRNGKLTKVSYVLEDGYYVLSINDISLSIIVTASDRTILYAKIILSVIVLWLCLIITKGIRRSRRNHFFKTHTSVYISSQLELEENKDIVQAREPSERISAAQFLNNK